MTVQLNLFGLLPRRSRRVMMHAVDTGQAPGRQPGWRTAMGGAFQCARCGYDAGWQFDMLPHEIRRGIPCPACNAGGAGSEG